MHGHMNVKSVRDVSPAGDLQTYLLHILRKMLLLARKYHYHYTLLCSNIVTSDDDSHGSVLRSLPPDSEHSRSVTSRLEQCLSRELVLQHFFRALWKSSVDLFFYRQLSTPL